MQYTTEVIDRQTGDLVMQSLGEWKTVSELAIDYGAGKNEFRHTLIVMGLLSAEGRTGRRRITPDAVHNGFGKRIEPRRKSRVKYPFDVISPKGQAYIAAHWSASLLKVETERRRSSVIAVAADALAHFAARRTKAMTAQMRVCWLLDHMPDITHEAIASVISSTRQLVSHYARIRDDQRSVAGRRRSFRERFSVE